MDADHIQVLDCTLRDGGQALESICHLAGEQPTFTAGLIDHAVGCLSRSNLELIELGYLQAGVSDLSLAKYSSVEEISKLIPAGRKNGQQYLALFMGPDFELSNIPNASPDLVDGLRVVLRYSELQKSLDFCEALAHKGYRVFVQPMLTMRYSEAQLREIIDRTNRMHAHALYFVDSYGYMQPDDVTRLFNLYDSELNPEIRIGFHAHNNLNLAFSNALVFMHQIARAPKRWLIVDACAMGMGQGAGNLQTELVVPYLNRYAPKQYDYDEVLGLCELVEPLTQLGSWGYAPGLSIAAAYHAAYKYAMVMRKQFGLTYPQINRVYQNLPDEFKQRYTDANLKQVLQQLGLLPAEPVK